MGNACAPLVTAKGLRWLRGEPKRFRSSNKVSRGFCAECGTPLTYEPDGFAPEIAIATLDRPGEVAPVIQIGLESRLPWFAELANLPTRSPAEAEKVATFFGNIVSNQHPDAPAAPIHLVPHDRGWPAQFEAERRELERVIGQWIAGGIEHVGSTAVPGLAAKPVIDIMVGVESLVASEPAKQALRGIGYQYAAYKTEVMHWFYKPSLSHRTHHLHLVPFESVLWHERLAFRDLLRRDPQIAREYEALKLELAKKFEFDRDAYTDAKYPFIQRVLSLS